MHIFSFPLKKKSLHTSLLYLARSSRTRKTTMALPAAESLLTEGLDPLSRYFLSWIQILDDYGAQTWNLRLVGLTACGVFLCIRLLLAKKAGVDWYAFTHALVSASGAIVCVYLDHFASEIITGTPEPLRSCEFCAVPLTSLHRILPAITMGYSLFDLLDGFTLGVDFILHGAATLAVMIYFCETSPQIVVPYLLMEVSTPFLTVIRAEFFNDLVAALNLALFAGMFFLCRIVLTPYLWYELMKVMYRVHQTDTFRACFPRGFAVFSVVLGIFFHCLNSFWFYKIVRKAVRKFKGEGLKSNNDLVDEEDKKKK